MTFTENPPAAALDDAEARDTFTDTLNENFCVSAGAGVGKTTAIVRRIANLALRRSERPSVLSRLVVVTYGKLAAEELRIRARDLVLEHLDKSSHGRQTLLADLRGAFFGTIHSFCLKLIRDEGRFLGLPETIGLLEDRDAAKLWEKFCESEVLLALELPKGLLERVSRHLTFDQLLDLARQFGPDETEADAAFDPEGAPPALDFSAALDDDGGRSKEKTREHQRHLRRWQEEFTGDPAFLQLPEYKGGSSSFLAAVESALEPYTRWLNAAAGCLAVRIARAYRDYRLDKGLMTFRDQIYWCHRLVMDPLVLNRLRLRGYLVILDEAQDTDAEMFTILTEITRPIGAVSGAWPGVTGTPGPESGRFCFVGDDQQAIYGERADLAVYRRYIDAFKAGDAGRYLEFSVTMRCPRRVIDAVNGVFGGGRIMQEFVEFRALDPRPGCPDGAAWRLELSPVAKGEGKPGLDARLTHECKQIADFVGARGLAGLGIKRWSEVAVICPRVRWLETAARIFGERGLPGALLSQRRLARELARYSWPAALLHVLIHPWDRFELIGVLREIFAVSDVDMARLHRQAEAPGGGVGMTFWPKLPDAKNGVPSTRLRDALKLLHTLRAKLPVDAPALGSSSHDLRVGDQGCVTLSRYVETVLESTALGARLEVIGEPASSLDQLRARALRAECEGTTLRAWVRSLVAALEEPVPTQPGAQDAVQFLTCLKAKGLEWPVVIPLGLGCEIRERPESYPRVERQEGRAEIHFSRVTVDPARKTVRTDRCAEEFQRMLYVTLTRAKRLLIAPDGRGLYDGRDPNFLALARWDELDLPALFAPAPTDNDSASPVASKGDAEFIPTLFRENKRRLKQASVISRQIPRRILPSGLVHNPPGKTAAGTDTPPAGEDDRLRASEDASLQDGAGDEPLAGIGGIEYGNWWHAVMQHYPWTHPDPMARTGYLQEQRERINRAVAWTARAQAELALFADGMAHAEFLEHGEVFLPEMPFSHPRSAHEWIEGIMDLVLVTRRKEIWIVDWKTDRRWSSDADDPSFLRRLAGKYGPQLQAYAEVFARGFGRPVSRLLLYSTVLGMAQPID